MFGIPDLITKAIDNLSGQSTGLDDAVDRLNYLITTFILACFAIIIGTKQHFGQPIQCMTPPEFQSGWNEYVEDYCFIQNTFVFPQDVPLMRPERRPNALYLSYYQWVPFIFLAQALLFYFPNFIWQALQTQTGMDLQTVVAEAKRLRTAFGKDRQEGTVSLMAYIEDCLRCGSRRSKTNDAVWPRFGRSSGTSSASVMYLFIKLCYLTNVVVQFFLINQIIGSNHAFWGWEMLGDVYKGRTTVDSGWFPRVTLCDFVKRENGNTHNHTVQCVLMVNMMNEKLFLFLWFWFLFVALCVLLSLVYLFATLVSSYFRERRVLQYLSTADRSKSLSAGHLRDFWLRRLGLDGLLLLHFIEIHAGALMTRELAAGLWDRHFDDRKPQRQSVEISSYVPLIVSGKTLIDDTQSRSADEGFSDTMRELTAKRRDALSTTSYDTLSKEFKESGC